jgi:ABC-2 type transport system permease protein
MFNKRTLAVVKRELKEKLFSKTFILMTLLIPIFLFAILGLQTLFNSFEGDNSYNLKVVSNSQRLANALVKIFNEIQLEKNSKIQISTSFITKNEFEQNLSSIKKDILTNKYSGVIFVPDSALINKKVEYYSKNPNNISLFNKIKEPIDKAIMEVYFSGQNMSELQIEFARKEIDFIGYRISSNTNINEAGYGNTIVAYFFTFLLYFSLLFLGTMIMRSVVQEKNNRIVEVLLSSVSSTELMIGKIIGNSIVGVVQMAIWLLPLITIISTTWFVLPSEFALSLTMGNIIFFLINYFIGLVTFLGLFTSVGAIFDNEQDSQSGVWPITILIMIPFFISISMINNPESPIAKIASMFPFASIIVMPARLTITDVPSIEIIISLLINLATMLLIFPLAGKIYRVGVLMTGKKPKWSEVIKWVRTN